MKKSAAIISKPSKPELAEIVPRLVAWLRAHDYGVIADRETAKYGRGLPAVDREKIAGKKPGFVIVLGGDGTMLSAARAVARTGIPILGVNLGSLGFLNEVPLAPMYPTLELVDRKRGAVEARTMVHCEVFRRGKRLAGYDALNDAVVNKTDLARI